jgi:hypothetical protein
MKTEGEVCVDDLKGDIRNIKPPNFDGDHKKDKDETTWLLGNEEIFLIAQLSIKCRIHNCNLPYSSKNIYVVGSTQKS